MSPGELQMLERLGYIELEGVPDDEH